MTLFKPMLAKEAPEDLSKLQYPLIVQPKLDGIRCTIVGGRALSRKLKEIPNREIFGYLSRPEFEGLDGEIVVGDPSDPNAMQATSSFVMSKSKTGADWAFHVFDWAPTQLSPAQIERNTSYDDRAAWLDRCVNPDSDLTPIIHQAVLEKRMRLVEDWNAFSEDDVYKAETHWLDCGLEGVILRTPDAPYKCGRSGTYGPLLKLKRFIDFEAKITGVFELMHNGNEAKKDALGRTERSTAKDGLVGLGTLGGFICEAINGPHEGQRFRVGTGFTADQRAELWWPSLASTNDEHRGKIVKIKSFPVGTKDAPRFPVFLGFRDMEIDG